MSIKNNPHKLFVVNCSPDNWDICQKHEIFGLKIINLPPLEKGDLIFVRQTGKYNGIIALWYFEKAVPILKKEESLG